MGEKINNIVKKSFGIALCLLTAVFAVNSINAASDSRIPQKNINSKLRLIAGEISVISQQDAYINLQDAKKADLSDILKAANVWAGYSVTGDKRLEDDSQDPEGMKRLLKRMSVPATEIAKVTGATKVGPVVVKGVYTNEEIAATGKAGVENFTLNINIVEDGVTSYDPNADSAVAAIHAQNYEFKFDDAASFNKNSIKSIDESQLKVWDTAVVGGNFSGGVLDFGKDLSSILEANTTDVAKINNAKYPSAFEINHKLTYYAGLSLDKKVTVFVTGKNSIIDRAKGIVLFANDIEVTEDEAKSLTAAEILTRANAEAYNFKTGAKLDAKDLSIVIDKLAGTAKGESVNLPISFDDKAGKDGATSIDVKVTGGQGTIPPNPAGPDPKQPTPNPEPDKEAPNDNGDGSDKKELPRTGNENLSTMTTILGIVSIIGSGVFVGRRAKLF